MYKYNNIRLYITRNMISIYYISLLYMKYQITKGDTGKRAICNVYAICNVVLSNIICL